MELELTKLINNSSVIYYQLISNLV